MQTFVLDVRGDFACFSRPELSVERFSYPCPTPSAARGIFDAIFLKPEQFRWQIERIEILKPVAYVPLRRNEVKETISVKAVERWIAGKELVQPILADADKALLGTDEKGRTQRQTMALRDVRYRVHAHIRTWRAGEELISLERQFMRRATAGKCFTQPYFGQREFVAYFRLADDCADFPEPVPFNEDVGWMLYDVFDQSRPGKSSDPPSISLFRARIQDGILEVPPYDDGRVRKAVRVQNNGKEVG
jgi:CRISPR-associated protein Cas5d